MKRVAWIGMAFFILLTSLVSSQTGSDVHASFFWSRSCPHCERARPFVESLETEYPWLKVEYLEVSEDGNAEKYSKVLGECRGKTEAVPGFYACNRLLIGYRSDDTTGAQIRELLLNCSRDGVQGNCTLIEPEKVFYNLPFIGRIEESELSFPLFTALVAGADGLNPSGFFIIFLLFGLMAEVHSRTRVLSTGAAFAILSALTCFILMAALSGIFLALGKSEFATYMAGAAALVVGILNVKDFLMPGRGVTLAMSEPAKAGLLARMKEASNARNSGAAFVRVASAAFIATAYSLLSNAGFPLAYTRILTLASMRPLPIYPYLALYVVVRAIPTLAAVIASAALLRPLAFSEKWERTIKLFSGLMMANLALILFMAPEALADFSVTLGIMLFSVALAVMAMPFARKK